MNWKKIVFPPMWLIILLILFSAVSLPMVFIKGLSETVIAYILYVISFYTLAVVCIFLSKILPKRYNAIKQKIYDNPIGKRYMTDASCLIALCARGRNWVQSIRRIKTYKTLCIYSLNN